MEIRKIYIIGFAFISIIGTLLHFLYEFSNKNKIVGIFSAVNESTWEHIKLSLTPYFLFMIFDGLILGKNPNYFFSKFIGASLLIIIMPILFYSYKFILKKNYLFIDILIFYITIFLSQYVSYLIIIKSNSSFFVEYLSLIMLFIIFACYLLLTIYPIKSKIFKDPVTNKYGI